MHVNDFFRRNLEFEKGACEWWDDGQLTYQGNLCCYSRLSLLKRMSSNSCLCLTHYYVLSYLLVSSFSF
ncbi:hypothetical protein HU200_052312 [Digitaria exilis]|uniref:Uncharacterized protein n=1 Tax=Digitaria exilis TaxID=1010633 RepID=A0A835AU55_9POAL|nr:hypothetical protein HU200_052312 [Digitaria exilis]